MATRRELVDFFFDTFPQKFKGQREYWYTARGDEDEDFVKAFDEVFNNMSPAERKTAADYLFANDENFKGQASYWYTDRGDENQDFVNAFGEAFSGAAPGNDAGVDESPDQEGFGGTEEGTVSILSSRDMQWFFDPQTGKWMVSYALPNSSRRVFFEARGTQLDAIFGSGKRPAAFEQIDFQSLATRDGYTFGGNIAEVQGTGTFEGEVDRVIALALDEGVLPQWARGDSSIYDLLYIAVSEEKSQDWLIEQIAKTDSFKQRFPNIESFTALGLTVAEGVQGFLELEQAAKTLVVRDGGNPDSVTPAAIGDLIAKGHSKTDLEFTYGVFDTMEKNAGALEAFNEVLASRGLNPLTEDDQFEFLAGNAPKDLYDIWEEASIHRAAQDAGLSLDVTQSINLARRTEGLTAYGTALEGLSSAASNILRFRNEIDLGRYGIDADDLVDLSLGLAPSSGVSQAVLARNMERAIQSAAANRERQRVNPFVGFKGDGTPQQASLNKLNVES